MAILGIYGQCHGYYISGDVQYTQNGTFTNQFRVRQLKINIHQPQFYGDLYNQYHPANIAAWVFANMGDTQLQL
jgi:hypothetical protein